jgi:YD repeat-containing protein
VSCWFKRSVVLTGLLLAARVGFSQSVDPLTGRLQFSIPLGMLEANDISIPISIYHKGTSLKVPDSESELGLGWSLSNLSITREVRGLPDDFNRPFVQNGTALRKGWLYNNNAATIQNFTPSADDNLGTCADEAADYNFLETHLGTDYVNDTEPDIFYVNLPGISTKFVFDATGTPRLLTHQDITITYTLANSFTITVKTNDGFVYSFEPKNSEEYKADKKLNATGEEYTRYRYNKMTGIHAYGAFSFITEWGIKSIYSHATNTTATFTYNVETFWNRGLGRTYHTIDSIYYTNNTYWRSYLASITLKSQTATFTWNDDKLTKITIEESGTQQKREVSFTYANTSVPGRTVSKAFLQSMTLSTGNCQPTETHTFEYSDVNFNASPRIPTHINWDKNWGMDYYGYALGDATVKKNIPRLYFYQAEDNSRRLRNSTVSGISATYQEIPGTGREPKPEATFGALTKVMYPAGGVLTIQYAANDYMDGSIPSVYSPEWGYSNYFAGPGVRVSKITTRGGEAAYGKTINDQSSYRAIVKEYEYTNAAGSQSSGLLLSPAKLGYITQNAIRQAANNLGEEPMVLYTRVKEKIPGQGYTVYEFNLPGMFPETAHGDWKATKNRIARKPGTSCLPAGNLKNGFYLYPYAPSTNYDFKRGLLSKMAVYSEANTLVREQSTTYTTLTKNPGVVKGIRFEKVGDIYHYGVYELLTGRVDVPLTQVAKEASREDATQLLQTTTTYAYNSNNLLQSVSTALPNSTTMLKTFKYANDFPGLTAADTASVAIKALNDNHRGAAVVEEVSYLTLPGSAQVVTGAGLTVYHHYSNGRLLPYQTKWLPTGASFTPASTSAQAFVADADYVTGKTFKEYDAEGRLLTVVDDKRNYVAMHYHQSLSYPVATLAQAAARQAVVETFEGASSFGLAPVGSDFQYTTGWTGEKAIVFTSGTSTLLSSATDLVQQGSALTYRVSCWVYGAAGRTITFRAKTGGTVRESVTLTNTLNNQWNYREAEFFIGYLGGAFQLEVLTNATASETLRVDDIVCVPVSARLSLQTILPLRGVTSTTDDRGHSARHEYDGQGRLLATYDHKRNLVVKHEYVTKGAKHPQPIITLDPYIQEFYIGQPATFKPLGVCDPATTIGWEVDGVAQAGGPGNSLTHTFTTLGNHTVKMIATTSANLTTTSVWTIYVRVP